MKKTKKLKNPAQNKIIQTLNVLSEPIASITTLDKNLEIITENKTQLKSLMVEKAMTEQKPNQLISPAKSQQKPRVKRKHIIKDIALEYLEVG